ncbi:MAG: uroporphyrinogen-III synthase, partial [Thermoleophilia bacterium]
MSDRSQPRGMDGAVIGITAARRAGEQAKLVEALGGVAMVGPTLDLDRPATDEDISAGIAALIAHPPEVAVFMTGIGARHIFGVAKRTGAEAELLRALTGCRVIARGGKARRALRELGRDADWSADPPEAATVRDALLATPLAGVRVVVQCAGPDPEALLAPL